MFGEYSEFHDSLSMVWGFPVNEFAICNPSGSALLTERLRLDAGFALSDTGIFKDNCAQCVRIGSTLTASHGKKVDGTPVGSGDLTGTYTVPLDTGGDWCSRAEYSYPGKMYGDRLKLSYSDAASAVNLRTGLRTEKYDALKVALPDRRQWGIRGTYRFQPAARVRGREGSVDHNRPTAYNRGHVVERPGSNDHGSREWHRARRGERDDPRGRARRTG